MKPIKIKAKTARGAASQIARALKARFADLGAEEIIVRKKHRGKGWLVIWEGGPYEWAVCLANGASLTAGEFPEFGWGKAEVTFPEGPEASWIVEAQNNYSLVINPW